MKSKLEQITKKYNKWEGLKFRTCGIIKNQVERSLWNEVKNFNNKAGVTFKSIIESSNAVQLFEAISITVKQYNSAHPLQIAQKELHQYFSKSQGQRDFDVYFEEVIEQQKTAKMMNGKIMSEVFAVHAIEMLKQDLPANPKVANDIKSLVWYNFFL